MNTGIDVNQAFARCRTLLDALLTVNSLGIRSGLISITTPNLHGWVAFESKHIIRALVVETGQIGRPALHVLSAVNGATYTYQEPESEAVGAGGDDDSIDVNAQRDHNQTTMMFGGDIVMFRNPQSDTKSSEIGMQFQPPMTDAEFRKGVFGQDADPHEEFMKKNSWLSQPEPPLKDFVQHKSAELNSTIDNDAGMDMLSRAGFAVDFRDPSSDINRRRATRQSMEQPGLVTPEQAAVRLPKLRYIAPFALAFGALLGYVDSLYQESHYRSDLSQYAVNTEDHGKAPFILPDATNSPPPAAAPPVSSAAVNKVTPASSTVASLRNNSASAQAKPPRVPEPADAKEFALAGSRTTLAKLEQLIRKYMAQKKFKHARDLAGAGFRSPVATPEEKHLFWALFQESNRNKEAPIHG